MKQAKDGTDVALQDPKHVQSVLYGLRCCMLVWENDSLLVSVQTDRRNKAEPRPLLSHHRETLLVDIEPRRFVPTEDACTDPLIQQRNRWLSFLLWILKAYHIV